MLAIAYRQQIKDSKSTDSDNLAIQAVMVINPSYQPWATCIWKPSTEVECGLFALQAACGALVIGYYLGFKHGQLTRKPDHYCDTHN